MSIFRRYFIAAASTVAAVCLSGAALAQSAATVLEGRLTVQWADPRPGQPGEDIRFTLYRADGSSVPLGIAAADQAVAIGAFNKTVRVETKELAPAVVGAPIPVDKLTILEAGTEALQPTAATRRVLYILVKFKGDAQTPHSPGFYKVLTNPTTPTASTAAMIPATINGFFQATSWGKQLWSADVAGAGGLAATGWLVLPRTHAEYASCGWSAACANLGQLAIDAITLVKAQGVDISVYSNLNFVLNNDLDCCAWGGGIVYDNKAFGATWEPPWGQETSVYVHEMGHSLGLPHSGWVYFAYDSPWDQMSRGISPRVLPCGSYKSVNSGNATNALYCTEPGGGYIAPYKDKLGWLPAANIYIINSVSTRTLTLEADSSPLGSRIKMIKICFAGEVCTGSKAHYLTLEARVNSVAYDKGVPGEGVIIHDFRADRTPIGAGNACFFNSSSGWAVPIDATAGDWRVAPNCDAGGRSFPGYALYNAQFGVGQTYDSGATGLRVEVLSRSGTLFTVRVTRSK